MTKAEINRKLDEIIDFSGCERFIDTPVKRYSSGMTVRLGFAVAAHLEPEILVVDEVLAVGDAEFQKKAIGKMQDVSKNEGRTVLFVSHNMAAVRNLCSRGIILTHGGISFSGGINYAIQEYLKIEIKKNIHYPKNNLVKSIEVKMKERMIFLTLKYDGDRVIRKPNLGFVIYDKFENPLFGTNPINIGYENFGEPKSKGKIEISIKYPLLTDGTYPISIWFSEGIQISQEDTIYEAEKCVSLNVEGMNDLFIQKNISAEGVIIPILEYQFS
jgi:lipopolysaccharide transport system ATP-binding protein